MIPSQMKATAQAFASDLTWSEIVERGYIIAGGVDTVIDRLSEVADTLNVGHLLVNLHFGNMPKETVLYNTQRFADEVIPRFRSRFADWEDRWWPKDTLTNPAAPAALPEPANV
jgi:hypothetical protein